MMKLNKHFFSHKLNVLCSLFFLASLWGCGVTNKSNSPKQEEVAEPAIILFHGLNDRYALDQLEQKLTTEFHGTKVKAFNRSNSCTSSIFQQVQEAYDAIKREGLDKHALKIVGDSQGGIIAALLAMKYGEQLNIERLVPVRTPFEGAHIVEVSQNDINSLKQDPIAQNINYMLILASMLKGETMSLDAIIQNALKDFTQGQGALDLKPSSSVLQYIKQQLSQLHMPITAIGGHQINLIDPIAALMGWQPGTVQSAPLGSLDETWAQHIVKEHAQNHDFIISLNSQLARGIANKSANFKEVAIPGLHHLAPLTEGAVYTAIVNALKQ